MKEILLPVGKKTHTEKLLTPEQGGLELRVAGAPWGAKEGLLSLIPGT